jgi:hypothetical protein
MDLTRRIREKMMEERLMFVYRGVVTSENSVPMLMLLEKEMQNSEFGFVGRKRLFMFVLESLQNVSRHGEKSSHADMSMVLYSKTATGYTVMTGNMIPSSATAGLREKLDAINNLEPQDVRNVYRQMLSNSVISDKGGAGLGLIEMAKKTGNKLDYDIVKTDPENSYFILSKTVDAVGTGRTVSNELPAFNGRSVSQLERIMSENNVNLIWMGHITPDVGKEVLSFTETKLVEEDTDSTMRKRVFSILVEILENVEKYSPGREAEDRLGLPMVILRMVDNEYIVTTGNLILNENVSQLREKLDYINNYDKKALRALYKESLSGQTLDTDSTGNMGLIDMAIKSGSKLQYDFDRFDDLYSYYILTVKVEDRSA